MYLLILSLIISAVIFRLQKDNELDSIIRREKQKGIKKKQPKTFGKIFIITTIVVYILFFITQLQESFYQ